jgi:uncharacterized protein Veg
MILFAYLNEVGDDMICPNDITSLKTDINEMIGQKIMIKGSLGRCRTFEKEATIEKTYPNIFTILINNEEKSFAYRDIATKDIKITYF